MEETVIDVREYPEFAAGHIRGAKLVPLGTLSRSSDSWNRSTPLTLVCRSGRRAEQARELLAHKGFRHVTVLPGGMDGWIAAAKSTEKSAYQPWAMERQVRTAAGTLIVATVALGVLKSRYFLVGTAIVGAGLVFAGVSDTCVMASALAILPWNRPSEKKACSFRRRQATVRPDILSP